MLGYGSEEKMGVLVEIDKNTYETSHLDLLSKFVNMYREPSLNYVKDLCQRYMALQ